MDERVNAASIDDKAGVMTQHELAIMGSSSAIGILGGTFDPIHIAHLRLAIEAREALSLAQVLFVPAGQPPLRKPPQASAAQRLAMVTKALSAMPEFTDIFLVDEAEVVTHMASYTVKTLERLRAQYGVRRPLVLLMGADAFAKLPLWHRWQDLFGLAHIGVATRPAADTNVLSDNNLYTQVAAWQTNQTNVGAGETATQWSMDSIIQRIGLPADISHAPAGRIVPFSITPLAVSSTLIRQRLAAKHNVRHLVSDHVLDYIATHSIY